MKRTDQMRKERELRRVRKRQEVTERRSHKGKSSVGQHIKELQSLFFHDEQKIYNINSSEEILENLERMKESLPNDQWDTVIRKAVRNTGIVGKEAAITEIKTLAGIL